jgi:hypothetical protein
MTRRIRINYHDPRTSESVNDRFVSVVAPGPKSGFQVVAVGGTATVRIRNDDGVAYENCLVTPEGVVIHETDAIVEDLDVGAATVGTRLIVCRHVWGTPAAAATFLCVTVGAWNPAIDTLLARIEKPGVGNVTDAMIFMPPRPRWGGATFPVSSVYGVHGYAVRSVQPLALGQQLNSGAFMPNHGTLWPTGVRTYLEADVFVPSYHELDPHIMADPTQGADLTVKLWLAVSAVVGGRDIVVDLDWCSIVDGGSYNPAVPTGTDQQKYDMLGKGSGDVVALEFAIASPAVDRFYHLLFSRRADLVADNWNGTAYVVGAVMYYARNRVGALYV